MSKGNENWFEKSGRLRNREFEKSGLQGILISVFNEIVEVRFRQLRYKLRKVPSFCNVG